MFFYHSATKGMIRANLEAFFTSKSYGMTLEEALGFMIGTRYSLFPEKKVVFFRLCALFQEYIEDEIDLFELDKTLSDVFPDLSTEAMDHVSDAFGELIMVLRFHAPEILKNFGEKEKEELEMLRRVISLMFLYESGAIFKSTKSFSFPTDKWMTDFIQKIDKEYCEKLEGERGRIEQGNITSSKFKSREEYEEWKAQKIKEAEENSQRQKEIDIVKEPNQLKDAEEKTILLVDDDIHIHRLIDKEFLFRDKMDLVHFYSPKDAFNYLLSSKVHLIISCIRFPDPDIDGIHFLRACKTLCPKLPFIIHTSYDYSDDFHAWAAEAYIVKSSDLSELFKTMGNLLDDKNNTEELNSEIRSGNVKTLLYLGNAYAELKMYENAIETFKKAIKLDSNIVDAYDYYHLGVSYNGLSMYKEAIEAYRQAIRIKPDYADAYYRLGFSYLYSGQKSKALEEYNKLKNIDSKLAKKLLEQIHKNKIAQREKVK